jgi:hypothetical protein
MAIFSSTRELSLFHNFVYAQIITKLPMASNIGIA